MTNSTGTPKKKRKEKGIALLIVIFALLLVTGIALAMMSTSDTESQINRNYRDSQKAYFAALAGIQEARVRLLTDSSVAPSGAPSASNNMSAIYILNPNAIDATSDIRPWDTSNKFFDDELCHEFLPGLYVIGDNSATPNLGCQQSPGTTGWYTPRDSSDPNRGTSAALDLKWVRITPKENRSAGFTSDTLNYRVASSLYDSLSSATWDPICWDGKEQVPLNTVPGMTSCKDESQGKYWEPVYRIVSLAQTSSAGFGTGSRRMVIAEVAKTPPLVTNAAVDSQDHVTLNGQLNVNGFDSCTCDMNYSKNNGYVTTNCTTTTVGGVQTTTCPNRTPYTCDNSKYAIYASGTIDKATSSENLVAGTNPAVVQNQPWIYDINDYINTYKQGAVSVTGSPYNYTCTAPTYDSNGNLISNGTCGTESSQTFGIPPNFPLSYNSDGTLNTSGQTPSPYNQVTYVPGDLQLTSSSQGNGILIVDGDLDIHGGLNFYGLILVKGVVKFTGGGSDHTNIIGAVLAGQESYVDNTLGGSAVINFNSCALKQNQIPQPPRLLSIREATY
ncbi:MAG: hypothetical protein ROO76_00820 [Terriglobia bacterium]|jgi:hypothetical protein|nr:hypothetical protein [Terriglobia bacterium]